MIESITLGQVAMIVTFLVSLIGGITYLKTNLASWVRNAVKDELDDIRTELKEIDQKVSNVDLESVKNFLVTMISEIERGTYFTEVEMERFWEQYEYYLKMGGNTYIKKRIEKLQKENKL